MRHNGSGRQICFGFVICNFDIVWCLDRQLAVCDLEFLYLRGGVQDPATLELYEA